jgi:hypothetical protein
MSGFFRSLLVSFGLLSWTATAQAAAINFSTWTGFGDFTTPSLGTANLSNNALQNEDSPQLDSTFNFSANPAVESFDLENGLGLTTGTLDPTAGVSATEGSALTTQINLPQPTTLSFNWSFQTNDSTFTLDNFGDYAFLRINNSLTTLASTNSSLVASSPYARAVSGTFSQVLPAGNYNISLGVVDVVTFDTSSALSISLADLTPLNNPTVPEPGNLFGLGLIALGLSLKARNF